MSFKIIKGRKIQEWIEETNGLVKIILQGKEIPIDVEKLPPQLQIRIQKDIRKQKVPIILPGDTKAMLRELFGVDRTSLKDTEYTYKYSWAYHESFSILKQYLEIILKMLSTFVEESESKPINIEERIIGGWAGSGWAFKGYIHHFEYKNQPPYSKEEEELLMLEQYDLERQKFERLKRKYKSATVEDESYKRERISEEVRIAVWRRDDGKCARCGNRENLEYDHIVPVSKGGGDTARNIELLCESCNRKKSNKIE